MIRGPTSAVSSRFGSLRCGSHGGYGGTHQRRQLALLFAQEGFVQQVHECTHATALPRQLPDLGGIVPRLRPRGVLFTEGTR